MDKAIQTGPALWEQAKKRIPGGNQLLSKRSEMFLPGHWPSYYQKAKGCEVWDLEGTHYYDFAQMGVGSCVLGYADEDVNAAVKDAIDQGSMCSLNSYEEVALADRLIDLHPWAEMARFARTGGEICAMAIRIARAATGRDKIAFCGYHGWHDWYLSANLADTSNLDGQLLPGLAPRGVPRALNKTALPFYYNDDAELLRIAEQHGDSLAAIIMEPRRAQPPKPGFLEKVREVADRTGAVFIFDEITSGFRMNMGGIHLTYDVHPDMAVFGKALGNGFPISAVIGKKSVMDAAQESFISSTFWTERTGYAAALATLEKMDTRGVPPKLVHYGKMLNEGWQSLSQRYEVPVEISGIPPLTHLAFRHEQAAEVQTYYTQEMLKKGYLLGASVYTTFAYSEEVINRFLEDSASVFEKIGEGLRNNTISQWLEGPVKHSGFKRLT